MGLAEILFIVFLVLKLTGVIAWSWWAVTAPLWIVYLLVMPVVVVLYAISESKYVRRF